MSPTLGDLFKELLSDSLSAEKNTEVVRLINLRMGEFVCMFIECLSTWNLWKQFQDSSLIIASACYKFRFCNVFGKMVLCCSVEQKFTSEERGTLLSDANLTQTFIVLLIVDFYTTYCTYRPPQSFSIMYIPSHLQTFTDILKWSQHTLTFFKQFILLNILSFFLLKTTSWLLNQCIKPSYFMKTLQKYE